jgi:hypothetical protein
MKGRPYRKIAALQTLPGMQHEVFADYPYCEKHKEIYEIAKMSKLQV